MHRQQAGDRVGVQPARDERQHLRRIPVQPLRVVDDHQQRPLPADISQERQHAKTRQETVRRAAAFDPGELTQGIPLGRQAVQAVQEREQHLVQARESRCHLRLDRGHLRRPNVAGLRYGVLEQRGLPHAQLASQHERTAQAILGGTEQAIDRVPLGLAIEQDWLARGRAAAPRRGDYQPERLGRKEASGRLIAFGHGQLITSCRRRQGKPAAG
jgi:hypothetical protein